jgi:hypothetical protein
MLGQIDAMEGMFGSSEQYIVGAKRLQTRRNRPIGVAHLHILGFTIMIGTFSQN